jgi:hypothetical protein
MRQTPDDLPRRVQCVLVKFAIQPPLHEFDRIGWQAGKIADCLMFDFALLAKAASQQDGGVDFALDGFFFDRFDT